MNKPVAWLIQTKTAHQFTFKEPTTIPIDAVVEPLYTHPAKEQLSNGHLSDCAIHNEPAYRNKDCDCGFEPKFNLSDLKHEDNCRYFDDGEFCTCGAEDSALVDWYRHKEETNSAKEQDCCGDGNVYRGVRSKYSEIPTIHFNPVKELHLSLQKEKETGELLAVTYTDDEHRIVEVLWQRPPVKEEAEQQSYQEADGCPTELVVLKRFWRQHNPVKELTDEEIYRLLADSIWAVGLNTDCLDEQNWADGITVARAILRKAQEK